MIPETKDLKLVFLELSSKRKLIGYIEPAVFETIFEKHVGAVCWFKLYHPVEAHAHMVTRDFFESAEQRYPGTGIMHTMNRDPQMRQQLEANALGDNSPLIRYYNDMKDRGPMWRLYYVYMAGCDYAKPSEPMVMVQHDTIEMIFPYKEESDQQLKMLYDVEIRGLDPKLLAAATGVPQDQEAARQAFRGIAVPPGTVMPGAAIPVKALGGEVGDPRYSLPVVPQEVKS